MDRVWVEEGLTSCRFSWQGRRRRTTVSRCNTDQLRHLFTSSPVHAATLSITFVSPCSHHSPPAYAVPHLRTRFPTSAQHLPPAAPVLHDNILLSTSACLSPPHVHLSPPTYASHQRMPPSPHPRSSPDPHTVPLPAVVSTHPRTVPLPADATLHPRTPLSPRLRPLPSRGRLFTRTRLSPPSYGPIARIRLSLPAGRISTPPSYPTPASYTLLSNVRPPLSTPAPRHHLLTRLGPLAKRFLPRTPLSTRSSRPFLSHTYALHLRHRTHRWTP